MNEKARNQLLDNGFVYTLRKNRHIEGIDWATDKRGGKKICDVKITYIHNDNYSKLYSIAFDYVKYSGFNNIEEWINIFFNYNKYGTFWLYRVERWLK